MAENGAVGPQTLAEWLAPYRQEAVAEYVGVGNSTAHCWFHGLTLPRDEHIPKLAAFLRISVAELVRIIAAERTQRSLERLGVSA